MATHMITVYPSRPLEVVNSDLIVEVMSDGAKIGELRISRGSIDWSPRNHHYPSRSLGWEQFAALMNSVEEE